MGEAKRRAQWRREGGVPVNPCANCGKPLDRAERPMDESARATPGDYTVCLYCGHLSVFDDKMRLRPPTDAEVLRIAGDPDYVGTQNFTALFRKVYPS